MTEKFPENVELFGVQGYFEQANELHMGAASGLF